LYFLAVPFRTDPQLTDITNPAPMSVSTQSPRVSALSSQMKGSEILRIAYEIQGLNRSGERIANFTVGDVDAQEFPIPSALRDGVIKYYYAGQTNYPQAMGVAPLREALSNYYNA